MMIMVATFLIESALAVSSPVATAASPQALPSAAEAELQLRSLNHRFMDAYRTHDAVFMDALTARDFLFTELDGRWSDRDAFLATFRQPPLVAEVANDDVHVRLHDSTGIVEGRLHGITSPGHATHARYTHVYAWAGGRWQLVNVQYTPIKAVSVDADEVPAKRSFTAWQGADPQGDDHAVLASLNAQYVQAFRDADVAWYEAHLAPGYNVVFGDGSLHPRAAALADFAKPYFAEGIADFPLAQVQVRRFGDVALIHAENAYTLKDGRKGVNRYTDIWVKQSGRWACVAAHITVHRPPH